MAILGSIGMAIIYGLKVNVGVGMVSMVNSTAIKAQRAPTHDLPQLQSNVTMAPPSDSDCVESLSTSNTTEVI